MHFRYFSTPTKHKWNIFWIVCKTHAFIIYFSHSTAFKYLILTIRVWQVISHFIIRWFLFRGWFSAERPLDVILTPLIYIICPKYNRNSFDKSIGKCYLMVLSTEGWGLSVTHWWWHLDSVMFVEIVENQKVPTECKTWHLFGETDQKAREAVKLQEAVNYMIEICK